MAEPKNPFDFGTGSIDKDQWLRDIDNEQDAFISRYGNAANKHRTALLRQAFADLRARIANGDMLNRTADGNYQFGSALNREDKHMQEAYQRALGFMGGLARRQILAPPAAEPEKKAIGSLEERYIKSLNPSGKFNTEAYWKNQTDEERRTSLKNFLNKELKDVENYQDFGEFGDKDTYTQKLQTVMNLLESGKANDWSLQQLGFTKNWLTLPQQLELEEEQPKSELEQAQEAYQEAVDELQAAQIRLQTAALIAPTPVSTTLLTFNPQQYWTLDSYLKELDARIAQLKGTDEHGNAFLKPGSIMGVTPMGSKGGYRYTSTTRTTKPTAWNGEAAQRAMEYTANQYNTDYNNALANYFKNLGVNYQTYLKDSKQTSTLMTNLAKLFAHTSGTQDGYVGLNTMNNLFTKLTDGTYGLKGTTLSYDPEKGILYSTSGIDNYGEGGVIKALNGYVFDSSKYVDSPKKQENTTTTEETGQLSNSENARIAATIADIASMGAAFVPGYGTAASAVLGLGSTATNFGADIADGQGLWNATKNAGFGLAADVMGLIPGLGGVGKGAKIARNLMWAVPKMMQWVNIANGLANAGEIKNSIVKLASPSSMTVQDWQNVSQALQIMTGHGRSVATKVKKAGMSKTTTTTEPEHYIFTNKGKQKVSDETFKRLREAKGTKARQALTLELMGEGVILLQTRFAPWNTSTRFGAFKEVPGKTKVEIQNKHKGWFSDENLVEKAENMNPSVDIRSIMHRVNPYRNYYNRRNQPVMPQRNYSSFEARLNGETSPLNVRGPLQPYPTGETYAAPKTKRKPLTDQQKAARKQKAADKKSKEQAKKQLEELRRNQGYALAEEIPQAGTYAGIQLRQQTITNLNSRYANEVELPTLTPRPAPGPRSEAFNKKYGRAIGKKEIGGILRALRNGGIIKALTGVKLKSGRDKTWYNDVFSNYEGNILSRLLNQQGTDLENSIKWLNEMLDQHSNLYRDRGDFNTTAQYDQRVEAYQKAYADGNGFILLPNGFNIGIAANYGDRYDFGDQKRTSGDRPTEFVKDGLYSAITDDRRVLGRTGDWTPELLNSFNEKLGKLGYIMDNKYSDGYYRIKPLDGAALEATNPNDTALKQMAQENAEGKTRSAEVLSDTSKTRGDQETGRDTNFQGEYKNPLDPTPFIIAGKTMAGLLGNKDVYGNLLKEMPQAPLRDPINRQLAIVGWLERVKSGQNQLADLRRILQIQQGSDQQTNFATALETERVGRDIMDKAFQEDSGRQFETAQKLWNLKNEDVLYNLGVGDANRRSIADRARMIAQIRAAWRSGDNNILMGGLSDAGNWLLKKYQREQDIVDRARGIQLGTPESRMQERLVAELGDLANKKPSEMTAAELAKVEATKAKILRESNQTYATDYYNTFSTPWFGGGYRERILKDGGSLEKEKLRARGKDNDRYVSMIKDLRHTSYRRRRRR